MLSASCWSSGRPQGQQHQQHQCRRHQTYTQQEQHCYHQSTSCTPQGSIYLHQCCQRVVLLQGAGKGSSTSVANLVATKTTHNKNNTKNVSTNLHNMHHKSSIYLPQSRHRLVGPQGVRNGSSTSSTNVVGTNTTHNKNNKQLAPT